MADYSIGDRVEVRWQAELFGAEVIHVHSPGNVDVVYDIDGSVGIFLTAKEHGLKLLGDEEKKGGGGKKKKVCVVDGCSNEARRKGQLCQTHGGKPCSVDGCSTNARARGMCQKHGGGLGECLREGCTTPAMKKGRLCSKHTVKLSCADPDCETPQILGKFVCIKHGAYGYCLQHEGCAGNTAPKRSARSTTAPLPSQPEAGAASTAVAKGKCARRKAAPLVQ